MDWIIIHSILILLQRSISIIGVLVILCGVIFALFQYVGFLITDPAQRNGHRINNIRLHLGRTFILGLEFIVAADLIQSTTDPGYYEVGILVIIVIIRTVLSLSLNRELMTLSKEV